MKTNNVKKEGFDYKFTNNMLELVETRPHEAISLLNDYIESHPNDYLAGIIVAGALVSINELDSAKQALERVRTESLNDKNLKNTDYNIPKETLSSALYCKLKLLLYQEKYKEAYDFVLEYEEKLRKKIHNLTYIKVYIEYKANMNPVMHENASYKFLQLFTYDEKRFIEHAYRHVIGKNENDIYTSDTDGFFYEDFPLEEIISEVKNNLPNDKKANLGFIENRYYFKYDNCGIAGKVRTDYFCIITYHNTNNFITIFPVKDSGSFEYVDLNYLNQNNNKIVKKMSQIEKFNSKYNV